MMMIRLHLISGLILMGILWLLLPDRTAGAQTLAERLRAEAPGRLAEDARTKGNIVRGAILFHQGNINCAKCHRPTSERDRLGPDLGRLGADATDAYLIESILQPSQVIRTGFETTVILTVDGRVFSGLVLDQDLQQIVVRDQQNLDQPVVISRQDIESLGAGTVSSMPENLVNELQDRQQFLDLLRYVIDIKDRGPEPDAVANAPSRRELSSELSGLALIQKLNCIACHRSESALVMVKPKQAPRLKWSAQWLNPDWMEQFIGRPHAVKPGTSMPEVLDPKSAETAQTAKAITHFLVSQSGNHYAEQPIERDAVRRGSELFHSVGCVACHAPRDDQAAEIPMPNSEPVGNLASKYSVPGLVEFLENPLAVRPTGHMPNMRLTHREATDIASFLAQPSVPFSAPWIVDEELAKQGERLFTQSRCHHCHTDLGAVAAPESVAQPLNMARVEQGCMSQAAGAWPNFHLPENDLQQIQAALQRLAGDLPNGELSRAEQLDLSLYSFNCLACHERNDLGGVTAERNPHFQTSNLNLGEQGRIPPVLTGVGAKLKSKWMREVLVTGRTIRPYMKTRMPQFGEENIGHLVELFRALDPLPAPKFAESADPAQRRKEGLELVGTRGLSCVSCHTYQYKPSDTMPAVDLTEMAERLEKEWFYHYMLSPQRFSPNTVMPSFWPRGQAVRKDLAGTPEDQLEALWQYLLEGRQAPMPQGVVREPLEIVVNQEAQMLRRNYPGIGKRGIGVGYPGNVNLAFDAEQMRLHAIWKGRFADPGGVWTGQGSGNVRPLGPPIEFEKGPDLDDRQRPWIVDEGRPARHQFQGYVLDAVRRPSFRYTFDGVEVEDYFAEVLDLLSAATHLRRTLTLSAAQGRADLRFRIASSDRIIPDKDQSFLVGDQLRIRVISDHQPQLVADVDDAKRLEVHLSLAAGEKMELVFDYLWEPTGRE
jgi:putative heme-binding domain-containing protein